MRSGLKQRFLPADLITAIYIILTALPILIFFNRLEDQFLHLVLRLLILIGIYFISGLSLQKPLFKFIRYFYPLLLIGFFYSETDYLNNIFFNDLDSFFEKLDFVIFGNQPSITFSAKYSQLWISELMYMGYFSYYLMIIGVPLAVYFSKPEKTEQTIFIIICSFLIYYLIFIIVPAGGPQFYFDAIQSKPPEALFFHKAVEFMQRMGEGETGAFPSSHVGLALVFLYLAFKNLKWLFYLLLPLVIFLCMATVYIKAHYFVDIIGGIITAPLFVWISIKLFKIINAKRIL
ncbi:phosphatase PAP2 family protein [Bacteroidota bacterium]